MLRLSCIAAFCLAIISSAFGQVAPGAPLPAGSRPTSVPVSKPGVSGSEDAVKLQYPNSDVVDLLRFYEELTGKKMVLDNNVAGKVNIFISKPVPREEAIKIIEMNLLLNGFSLIPAENDIVKVVGPGKSPRAAGVPIISDAADIPDGDHVISYLFKLRYADPQELQQALGQYLSPPQSYTSFLALPKSSSILVTENSSVIRSLVRIIDQIDVAPAEVVSEFIKLERADASKVVDMLKDIFEKGTQGSIPGYPGQRGVRPIVPQQPIQPESDTGGVMGLSEESVVVGKIKVAADVRTNRIHVITRPINMPFIRKLIAEFDANVDFAKPVTRPLRFVSAGDVLPVLVQALSEPGETQQGAEGGANVSPQQQAQQRRNPSTTPSPYGGTDNSNTGESSLNISEELSTQPVDTTPKAVTVGNAKLIADQRSNSIIVLGNREVVVKVEKILDEMDVQAPQVALSTVIGELTLDNTEDFGVDYFLQFKNKNLGHDKGVGGGVVNGTVPSTNIIDPASLISYPVFSTLPTGATAYVAAGNTLSAIVHALDSTGRFRTISRPMVFTSNNKKAIIASGTEIPVPVSTISSTTSSTTILNTGLAQQSNIQFKKVALQLEVVPLINSDKEVSLDILQKLDSIAGSTLVDGNSIPNIATRYIRTNVSAPNGSTIVLGGLITDDKERTVTGFPILSRIPVVGAIFRDTLKTKKRTELIVLMRPEVTLTPLDQYRLRQKTEGKLHFGAELDEEERAVSTGKELPPPDLPPTK